jgi:hypothetical protein
VEKLDSRERQVSVVKLDSRDRQVGLGNPE